MKTAHIFKTKNKGKGLLKKKSLGGAISGVQDGVNQIKQDLAYKPMDTVNNVEAKKFKKQENALNSYIYANDQRRLLQEQQKLLQPQPINPNNLLLPNDPRRQQQLLQPQAIAPNNLLLPNNNPRRLQPYETGGVLGGNPWDKPIEVGASAVSAGVDAFDSKDEYGFNSTTGNVIKSAASYGSAGAKIGGAFGGIGAAIGGGIGLLTGIGMGFFKSNKEKEARRIGKVIKAQNNVNIDNMRAGYDTGRNRDLFVGTTSGYKYGGGLPAYTTYGGSLKGASSDGVHVQGNSHSAGGVKIPSYGSEVEGGETIKGDYVFSKALGFAQLHKPIMKAKGLIEDKALSRDRINSIRLLNEKENKLKFLQEGFKRAYNIKN